MQLVAKALRQLSKDNRNQHGMKVAPAGVLLTLDKTAFFYWGFSTLLKPTLIEKHPIADSSENSSILVHFSL